MEMDSTIVITQGALGGARLNGGEILVEWDGLRALENQ